MNILVTGGSGLLGRELQKILPGNYPSRKEMDITDIYSCQDYIIDHRIDTIVHCAAMTSVRECEERKRDAFKTNVVGTENIVRALWFANMTKCYFIYVSTACVFRGDKKFGDGYSEFDFPYPKNYYGLTKYIGELAMFKEPLIKRLIIRTNFIERGKWKFPHAFADRYANYLYVDQVAIKIVEMIDQQRNGLVHIHGNKIMSMYEAAKLMDPDVERIYLSEYEGPPLTINMTLRSEHIPAVKFI